MALNSLVRIASSMFRSAGGCSRRFSSTSDLVRIIESDFTSQKSSHNLATMHIPDGFPFEIEDTGSILCLHRTYRNEKIRLYVDTTEENILSMSSYVLRGTQDMEFKMVVEPNQLHIKNVFVSDLHGGDVEGFDDYLKLRGFGPGFVKYLLDNVQIRDYPSSAVPSSAVPALVMYA